MLRMMDNLRSHPTYRRASALLVRAYLRLHAEGPRGPGGCGDASQDMSNMTAVEKKRAKAKASSAALLQRADYLIEVANRVVLDSACEAVVHRLFGGIRACGGRRQAERPELWTPRGLGRETTMFSPLFSRAMVTCVSR